MKSERNSYLLKQFTSHQLTEEETEEFLFLLQEDDGEDLLEEVANVLDSEFKSETFTKSKKWDGMLSNILSVDKADVKNETKTIRFHFLKWAYAAAILIFLSAGIWILNQRKSVAPQIAQVLNEDIEAGKNKAILILANGNKIIIEDQKNGVIVQNQDYKITKIQDSIIKVSAIVNQGNIINQNIIGIETPRGGEFQVIMPDGTKVWLNAASSIYFPPVFAENKRITKMTGEAYFEVASLFGKESHEKIPFLVNVTTGTNNGRNETVEVLGTHFNINSYGDEKQTITTLLEGSVKVGASEKLNHNVLLKPGEQAVFARNQINVHPADTIAAIAWKNNLFRFKDNDIKSIMRQLARWYNVDIIYADDIAGENLTGFIAMNRPLSKTLKTLSSVSDFSFKVENKTIIVSNQTKKP